MPRRKKADIEQEESEVAWLDKLEVDLEDALDKDCTQSELRKVLVRSFISFYKGREVRDGGKIIETLLKIAPTKSDPVEDELQEPVSIVAHAESILAEVQKTRTVLSEEMLSSGEEKKLAATVAEPYVFGDTVSYTKEKPHDGLKAAIAEATKKEEPDFITEEYDPNSLMQEKIGDEKMTMESGMPWEKIRENIETSRKQEHDPSTTMSIPEVEKILEGRKNTPKKTAEQREKEAFTFQQEEFERSRQAWAELQKQTLDALKARKGEED